MRANLCGRLLAVVCLCLAFTTAGLAKNEAASQAAKAAKVFREIMATPDKGVPKDILDKAYCVAVFPDVIKAGFIVGGRGGRGVASCRTRSGWSAPAFFELKGGSIGLQIGAQSTDFILLFMNQDGMNSLLKSKFEMGGDASVAAGPVGRTVAAATDLRLDSQILSYSRSKGLFAGLELKGSVIELDKSDMKDAYGAEESPQAALSGQKATPASVSIFPATLGRYSKRRLK